MTRGLVPREKKSILLATLIIIASPGRSHHEDSKSRNLNKGRNVSFWYPGGHNVRSRARRQCRMIRWRPGGRSARGRGLGRSLPPPAGRPEPGLPLKLEPAARLSPRRGPAGAAAGGRRRPGPRDRRPGPASDSDVRASPAPGKAAQARPGSPGSRYDGCGRYLRGVGRQALLLVGYEDAAASLKAQRPSV